MNTEILRSLTSKEVDTYNRDGVLLLENMFDKDWIKILNKGLDVNIKNPQNVRVYGIRILQGALCFMTTQPGKILMSTKSSFSIHQLLRFVVV
tara:strand:- start:61 stop:339 length:279 start_codon:yes stop_codon:yes gene_type:complete